MTEKILIVDDEKAILELASIILSNRGYEVLLAENAEDGLALIAAEAPALVLLDYMMPRMDGMTALRQIRQRFPANLCHDVHRQGKRVGCRRVDEVWRFRLHCQAIQKPGPGRAHRAGPALAQQ